MLTWNPWIAFDFLLAARLPERTGACAEYCIEYGTIQDNQLIQGVCLSDSGCVCATWTLLSTKYHSVATTVHNRATTCNCQILCEDHKTMHGNNKVAVGVEDESDMCICYIYLVEQVHKAVFATAVDDCLENTVFYFNPP